MRWTACLILACIDALLCWGCSSPAQAPATQAGFILPELPSTNPAIIYEPLDLQFSSDVMGDWGNEAVDCFGPGCVIVGCHGWYTVKGDWLVVPTLLNSLDQSDRPWPVEKLIAYEEALHPGHIIVLLCCNVDSVVLHNHPNVWYSPHENWMVPDAYVSSNKETIRHLLQPNVVGDIRLFVQAK